MRHSRRQFLCDAFAIAATAAATRSLIQAQGRGRIDVHHHFIPPRHLEAVLSQRESGRTPPWSPELAIEEMDRNGIATSICSLVQPGVWLGDIQKSRTLARECNEYGARMVTDRPG